MHIVKLTSPDMFIGYKRNMVGWGGVSILFMVYLALSSHSCSPFRGCIEKGGGSQTPIRGDARAPEFI